MIGYIRGILQEKKCTSILVDVNSIGYNVIIPLSTYEALPEINEEVKLYTYLHIREDLIELYGFISVKERDLFMDLISISDIGPKTAINILSKMKVDQFKQAILNKDINSLKNIPGIGKKTAERLIVELKDKIDNVKETEKIKPKISSQVKEDAIAALVSLGYKISSVKEVIRNIEPNLDENTSVEEVIKEALRHL
jgi:Holliday junction DNA helicase RuvA